MKNLLFISALLFGLSACDMADDGDYTDMATDMCGCFNDATEGLSDGGRKAIISGGGDATEMQAALVEYGQEHSAEAMQDAQVLMDLQGPDVMDCVTKLEDKYGDLYSTDSDEEKQEKLLDAMKKIKICDLTYALTKAGMQ